MAHTITGTLGTSTSTYARFRVEIKGLTPRGTVSVDVIVPEDQSEMMAMSSVVTSALRGRRTSFVEDYRFLMSSERVTAGSIFPVEWVDMVTPTDHKELRARARRVHLFTDTGVSPERPDEVHLLILPAVTWPRSARTFFPSPSLVSVPRDHAGVSEDAIREAIGIVEDAEQSQIDRDLWSIEARMCRDNIVQGAAVSASVDRWDIADYTDWTSTQIPEDAELSAEQVVLDIASSLTEDMREDLLLAAITGDAGDVREYLEDAFLENLREGIYHQTVIGGDAVIAQVGLDEAWEAYRELGGDGDVNGSLSDALTGAIDYVIGEAIVSAAISSVAHNIAEQVEEREELNPGLGDYIIARAN